LIGVDPKIAVRNQVDNFHSLSIGSLEIP
jgi:hypothetical protein